MEFSHSEMMLLIQGLRLINGLDQLGKEYSPTPEDQMAASSLLLRIDEDSNPNEFVDFRTKYGSTETNGLVNGHEYHAQVDYSPGARYSLKQVAEEGGKITRLRILTEKVPMAGVFCDISYINATLPDGKIVAVDHPLNNMMPKKELMGELIKWAKAQGVFAKSVGLLDKGNWSELD